MSEAAAMWTMAGIAAATTGYQVVQADKARIEGKKVAKQQADQAASLFEEQKQMAQSQVDEQARMKAEEEARIAGDLNRDQSRERLRRLASGKTGRQGTILTGPSGIGTAPTGGKKSLLGT